MRKRRIVHGASLTDFLIFCNKLLSERFPFLPLPSKTSRAAAWPVAALAVPQAGDIDLAGAEAQGCFRHPPVIALTSPDVTWADPALAAKNRARQSLLGRSTDLSRKSAPRRGCESQAGWSARGRLREIAAANAKGDPADVDVRRNADDRRRGDRLPIRWKARLFRTESIDPMSAERDDPFAEMVGLFLACRR
jgi:hypothetical protein